MPNIPVFPVQAPVVNVEVGDLSGPFVDAAGVVASAQGAIEGMAVSAPLHPSGTTVTATITSPTASTTAIDLTPPELPTFDVVMPQPPDMNELNHYLSDFLTTIKDWVNDQLVDGDDGLTTQTQDDIINLDTERDVQQLLEAKDRQAGQWATGNWSMPDSVLTAMTAKPELEYVEKQFTKSAEIRKQALKLSIEKMRLAVEWGLKVEEALQLFTITLQKIKAKIYNAEVDIFSGQIKATAAQIEALVKEYSAKVARFEAGFQLDAGNHKLVESMNNVAAKNAGAAADIAARSTAIATDIFSENVRNKVQAIHAAARACSVLAAGYFGSVHAQQSVSYSNSQSYEESASWSESNRYSAEERYTGDAPTSGGPVFP